MVSVNRFSGGSVSVKMLGPEWRHRMIDVCGMGEFRRRKQRAVFITHLDSDHLPLKEYVLGANLRFFTSSTYLKRLEEMYGDVFEVCEYTDVIETEHTTKHGRKYIRVKTFGFFFKEALVVPECDNPDELIKEYSPRFTMIFVAYQSHIHPVSFNNRRRDVFILDNRVWKPWAPNIIPKIVFSSTASDAELYRKYFKRNGR